MDRRGEPLQPNLAAKATPEVRRQRELVRHRPVRPRPETLCDDGNASGGDGCSDASRVEPDFRCPAPGVPCEPTSLCGDGVLTGLEACDDRNEIDGDGCSSSCELEAGCHARCQGSHAERRSAGTGSSQETRTARTAAIHRQMAMGAHRCASTSQVSSSATRQEHLVATAYAKGQSHVTTGTMRVVDSGRSRSTLCDR